MDIREARQRQGVRKWASYFPWQVRLIFGCMLIPAEIVIAVVQAVIELGQEFRTFPRDFKNQDEQAQRLVERVSAEHSEGVPPHTRGRKWPPYRRV